MSRRFTIVIVALAVSAAFALNVPEQQQQQQQQMYRHPQQQRQRVQQQQQVLRDPMVAAASSKHKPDKVVYVTEVKEEPCDDLLETALYKLIKVPKKVFGAVASLIGGKLKSLNAKGLIKAALLAGLVAVAAVAVITVAGLVSAITGVFATAAQFKNYLFGGGDAEDHQGEASQIDLATEFLRSAFDKYGEKQQ